LTTSPFKVVILSVRLYQRIRDAPGFTKRFDELNICSFHWCTRGGWWETLRCLRTELH